MGNGAEELPPDADATEAAKFVAARAGEAKESASAAGTSAESAAKALKTIRKKEALPTIISIGALIVSIITMIAVGIQSLLTSDAVDIARKEMIQNVLTQQNIEQTYLTNAFDDPGGPFQLAHASDIECLREDPFATPVELPLQSLSGRTYRHYHFYYETYKNFELGSEWNNICSTMKYYMDTFCHLRMRVEPLLENTSKEFKEAYESCSLPEMQQSSQ